VKFYYAFCRKKRKRLQFLTKICQQRYGDWEKVTSAPDHRKKGAQEHNSTVYKSIKGEENYSLQPFCTRRQFFLIFKASRQAVGPIQPSIQRVLWFGSFPGGGGRDGISIAYSNLVARLRINRAILPRPPYVPSRRGFIRKMFCLYLFSSSLLWWKNPSLVWRGRDILQPSKPALGPIQPLIKWVRYGTVLYCIVRYGTIRYCKLRYGTVLYITVRYCFVRYGMVRYCTVLYVTLRYGTVLYIAVRYGTVRYGTVLYCTVRYDTVRYCTVLYCTLLYCTVLYCTLRYGKVRYCTVRYGTVLYVTVRYCTLRYGTVSYGTVRYCFVRYGMVRYVTVLYDSVRYCTVLYVTVRYGTERYGTVPYGTLRHGTVLYGAVL
jgi:hypothetical protein